MSREGHIGKIVRWAYFKNEVESIHYVETNNKVPESDGCRPLMDLPDSFPKDLDHQKYIDYAREMLYDVGYLKRPKQVCFF